MAVALSPTCLVAPENPDLLDRVEVVAQANDRPSWPLFLQALLQLPRVADEYGYASTSAVDALLDDFARELPLREEWEVHDPITSPRSLTFREVDANVAADVMIRFHYLRSARTDARSLGLFTKSGIPVALCTSSPVDVQHLGQLLRAHGRQAMSARVLSRVFAFEGAPKNTISYLLARAVEYERHMGVSDYLTYVNPNLGFSGSSYRASGWSLLGDEPGTTYRYLDGRYITDRQLAALFERQDDADYMRLLGGRFSVSRMPLRPLLVFHRSLTHPSSTTV